MFKNSYPIFITINQYYFQHLILILIPYTLILQNDLNLTINCFIKNIFFEFLDYLNQVDQE